MVFRGVENMTGAGDLVLAIIAAPSYGWQAIMFYTYIIESVKDANQSYVGHTADLRQRIAEHNNGESAHTSKFLPWKLKVYIAFETLEQAQHFEQYMKSGSGRAFAKRHLLADAGKQRR